MNRKKSAFAVASILAASIAPQFARANDGTWDNEAADNNWRSNTNWSINAAVGAQSGNVSGDTATFSTTGSGTINLGNLINIKNISFGVSGGNAGAFTIGDADDILTLTNGGTIAANDGVTSNQVIGLSTTAINLSTTANSSYSFVNNGSGTLTFGGVVTSNQATGNQTALSLNGTGDGVINTVLSGIGTAGNLGLRVTKTGTGTWTLNATNLYTGPTALSGGTLRLGNSSASIAGSAVTQTAGTTFTIDNNASGTVTRAAALTTTGGTIRVNGTSAGATTDQITGAWTLGGIGGGLNRIIVTPDAASSATLNFGSISRSAGSTSASPGGIILVSGTNMGLTGATSFSRVTFGTAPSFTGSTTDGGTAPGTTKSLGIVNYILGEVDGSGNGTNTGTPNTFMTYNATTGLRPLHLTDEFTNNAVTTGNNIRITSATSSGTATVNSLLIDGATLTLTGTLTNSSGLVMFNSSNNISGGTLQLTPSSSLIYVNPGLNVSISAAVSRTGTAGNYNVYVPTTSTITFTNTITGVASSSGIMTISGGGQMNITAGTGHTPGTNGFSGTFITSNAGTVLNIGGSAGLAALIGFSPGAGTIIDLNTTGSVTTVFNLAGSAGGVLKLTNNTIRPAGGTGSTSNATITGGRGISFEHTAGTFTLGGVNNYAGGTSLTAVGGVGISGGQALSDTGVVNFTAAATLSMSGSSETIGSLNGTLGNVDNGSTTTTSTLTINTSLAGNGAFGGVLKSSGASSPQRLNVTKRGTGSQTLSGLSTYTGTTSVQNGSLVLDLGTNSTGVLAAASSMSLLGGQLTVLGKSTGASSQTFTTALALGASGGNIVLSSNGGDGVTLGFGAGNWTRSAGGTLNIDTSSHASNVVNGNATLTNDVLGYATFTDTTGTGFATIAGSVVSRYTGASALTNSSDSATTNFSTGGNVVLDNASRAINSLAINASTAGSLDLGGSGNVVSVTSGGVLVTGSKDYTIGNGQLGAAGSELVVHQLGTGTLNLNSTIGGTTTALTINGVGNVVLGATNNISGNVSFNGGVTSFSSAGNLGTGNLVFNGGTLKYASGNTTDITSGRTVTLTGRGATIDTNGNNLTFASPLTGASNGGLAKTGLGNLTLSGVSTYNGDTILQQGGLILDLANSATGILDSRSAVLGFGGTLTVQGKSTGASSQTLGGLGVRAGETVVTVNSNGGTGTTLTINNNWNRSGVGTVNFNMSAANTVLNTQTVSNTNGIVGTGWLTITDATATGFATYVDTAANVTNPIQRYTGATAYTAGSGTTAATTNYSINTGITLTAARSMNTLAVDTTSGSLAMGGAFALNTSAILMNGANDYTFNTTSVGTTAVELIVQQFGTGKMTIAGAVSGGAGSLTKGGTGTLELTGTSGYSGATSVNRGVLNVTGTGSINSTSGVLINGGTLGYTSSTALTQAISFGNVGGNLKGTGTVASITGGRDATIAGGDGTTGTLGVTGDLVLGAGRLAFTVAKATPSAQPLSTDSNHIDVTGGSSIVDLTGGDLVLTVNSGLEVGDVFYLLTNASSNAIAGTFAKVNGVTTNLAQNSYFNVDGLEFQISYTGNAGTPVFSGGGNDVALQMTAVPEPASLSLIGLAGAGLLARRRRRAK